MIEKIEDRHISFAKEVEKACFSAPWGDGSFMLLGIPAGYGNVVYSDDGEPAGYSAMLAVPDEAQLLRIAVLPGKRGQGLAREMLADLYSESIGRGCTVMTLEVREKNTAARKLYESEGFYEVGRRENYYTDPRDAAILMEKKL